MSLSLPLGPLPKLARRARTLGLLLAIGMAQPTQAQPADPAWGQLPTGPARQSSIPPAPTAADEPVPGLIVPAGPRVRDISAFVRSGQTFITWRLLPDPQARYRVYRASQPITALTIDSAELLGEADASSAINRRASDLLSRTVLFRIRDEGPDLSPDQGLFVHTVGDEGRFFYAVTAVIDGQEFFSIVPGLNALTQPLRERPATPRPVLQRRAGTLHEFVRWASHTDTPMARAMANRPSLPFNLRVHADTAPGSRRPVLLKLHSAAGSYRLPAQPGRPDLIVMAPDNDLGLPPFRDHWFGTHEFFPSTDLYGQGVVRDDTVQRVLADLDFVLRAFGGDRDRVVIQGQSMGAVGAIFIATAAPDRFAGVLALMPKFDFTCQSPDCWSQRASTDALWGPLAHEPRTADGISVYQRLSLPRLLARPQLPDLPLVIAGVGRADTTVGWSEKPPTFAAFQGARQPAIFYWDDSGHAVGAWERAADQDLAFLLTLSARQPVPAFTRLSIDDRPGAGPRDAGAPLGTINGRVTWEPASIIQTSTEHALAARLRTSFVGPTPAVAVADWTPRRLSELKISPGAIFRFTNRQLPDRRLIEDRTVAADEQGRLTVPAVTLTLAGNELRIQALTRQPSISAGSRAAAEDSTDRGIGPGADR